jgi:hypothetical protein
MKQVMWHCVWILMVLWVYCQRLQMGAFTHVLLVGALVLLVISVMKHDKIAFIKTFRDENLTYDD